MSISGVEYLKPTTELVTYIAENMRDEDRDEVWASDNYTPLEAMMTGWKLSDYCVIISVNGEPCVMIGLLQRDILTGRGIPWMLGTDGSVKYRSKFLSVVPGIMKQMLSICPNLYNYVHVKNKVSIRWLKRIGFTLCDPAPYGCDGELFHKFYIGAF